MINKNNNKHSKININNKDGGIFSEIKSEHCSDCKIQSNLFPLHLPLFETFNHTLFIYQIKKVFALIKNFYCYFFICIYLYCQ
jgi:hypothetical protein